MAEGLTNEMAEALAALFRGAPPEFAQGFGIRSGFRSNADQTRLWNDKLAQLRRDHPDWEQGYLEEVADNWVARPGGSRHERGTAVDIGWNNGPLSNAPPEALAYLHEAAAQYGLVFPLANEPWHIETVGARADLGQPAPIAPPAPQAPAPAQTSRYAAALVGAAPTEAPPVAMPSAHPDPYQAMYDQSLQTLLGGMNASPRTADIARALFRGNVNPVQAGYGAQMDAMRQNEMSRSAMMVQVLSGHQQMESQRDAALFERAKYAAERGDQASKQMLDMIEAAGVPDENVGAVAARVMQFVEENDINDLTQLPGIVNSVMDEMGISPRGDFQEQLAIGEASRATSNITIDQRGETSFAATAGEQDAGRRGAVLDAGDLAAGQLATLGQMADIVGQVNGGALQPGLTWLNSAARDLGVDIGGIASSLGLDFQNIGNAQEFQRLSNALVLQVVGNLSRGISEGDRRFLENMVPALSRDRESNRMAIIAMQAAAERSREKAAALRQWEGEHGVNAEGYRQFELDWNRRADAQPLEAIVRERMAAEGLAMPTSAAPTEGQPITVTAPDGRQVQVILRNGQWVDAATGQPIQ